MECRSVWLFSRRFRLSTSWLQSEGRRHRPFAYRPSRRRGGKILGHEAEIIDACRLKWRLAVRLARSIQAWATSWQSRQAKWWVRIYTLAHNLKSLCHGGGSSGIYDSMRAFKIWNRGHWPFLEIGRRNCGADGELEPDKLWKRTYFLLPGIPGGPSGRQGFSKASTSFSLDTG